MSAPKRIYLELNNAPPCDFGALWYTEEVPGGVAYRLESDVNRELAEKDEEIKQLKRQVLGAARCAPTKGCGDD